MPEESFEVKKEEERRYCRKCLRDQYVYKDTVSHQVAVRCYVCGHIIAREQVVSTKTSGLYADETRRNKRAASAGAVIGLNLGFRKTKENTPVGEKDK